MDNNETVTGTGDDLYQPTGGLSVIPPNVVKDAAVGKDLPRILLDLISSLEGVPRVDIVKILSAAATWYGVREDIAE